MKTPFLSTSFSQKGEKAKKRFANILDTKQKRFGVLFLVLAAFALLAFSLLFGNSAQQHSKELFYAQMGLPKETVFQNLNLREQDMQIETVDTMSNYVFEDTVDGAPCTVAVTFVQDYLMGYQFTMQQGAARKCFASLKDQLIESLGTEYAETTLYAEGTEAADWLGDSRQYDWPVENPEMLARITAETEHSLVVSLVGTPVTRLDQTMIVVRYRVNPKAIA